MIMPEVTIRGAAIIDNKGVKLTGRMDLLVVTPEGDIHIIDYKCSPKPYNKYDDAKKLTFEYYPAIRSGNFLGELVSVSKKDHTKSYELKLPTAELFAKVHGQIRLHYTVYEDKKIILLTNITPEGILDEGHRAELSTYKGVMISKTHPEKDMFKVNLLSMMQK